MQNKPSQREAKAAIETLIRWIGDDPTREGLRDTASRVLSSYNEFFSGYTEDPALILQTTFEETEGYNEMIILKDISFSSFCEHHILPFVGKVNIGYIPNKNVVGISKLARIVDIFANRLQLQEKLTVQIAKTIFTILKPQGVGVSIGAYHQCMSMRGVHKENSYMQTMHMEGCFKEQAIRDEFLNQIKGIR